MVEASKKTTKTTVAKKTTTTAKATSAASSASKAATAKAVTVKSTPAGRGQAAAAGSAARGGAQMVGSNRDDYECPVCLELCAQPILTPCKHFMCFQCNRRCAEMGMTCPMCRAHFDKHFIPTVDVDLQREIAEKMGHLFEERKQELEEAGDWLGTKRLMKFSYGNTHEEIKDPKPSRTGGKGVKNTHRWCMFVVLNGSNQETAKVIKQVTYHLHPTFKPSQIVLTEPPFLLSRVGWGYFDVEMDIEFQPSTGLGTEHLSHLLSFDGSGKTQSIFLEVNASGANENKDVAKQLAEKLSGMNLKEESKR